MTLSTRRRLIAVAGAGLLAAAGIVAPASSAQAAVACDVTYTTNDWPGGFTASVTLRNTGDALTNWTLGFTFPNASQRVTQGWSATWTQSGQNVTARNLDYNGTLASGASTSLGFNGSWSGSNPKPTSFTVNGTTCGGTTPGNTAPTVSLTSPTSGATFAAGAAIPLAATASDVEGPISRVEFLIDGTVVNSDTTAPYSYSATSVASGSHTAAARAFDSAGLSTTTSAVPFTVGGGSTTPTLQASTGAVSVPEGGSATVTYRLSAAPTSSVAVSLAKTGDTNITVSPTSFSLTSSNWSTGVPVTVSASEDTDTTNGTATIAATSSAGNVSVTATESDNDVPSGGTKVDNPYSGARGYVNPEWSAKAAAEPGGSRVSNQPTAVWLDRIAAIEGTPDSQSNGPMGVEDHLDAALAQGAGYIQFVIYNLPGRDCSALASNGELPVDGLPRYQSEYIDPIAAIMSNTKYRSLRIITIIEIDSLPNLVTNLNIAKCATMNSNGGYVNGVGYALDKLGAIPNVYNYIDAAHHGWIGWDSNFRPTAQKLKQAATAAGATVNDVHGFIVNTANYSALREEHFNINTTVNGQQIRQSRWVDWNQYVDELTFAQAFRTELVAQGFNSNIGMLIDTSRNGWGGSARPTAPSTSTDLNTFVDQSRIDRRIHAGNWCNQSGAGLGERPTAAPATGIDAYVWVKPPGESDGSSREIPNNDGKGFDRMCDPTYGGNGLNGNNPTGALPDAPISGAWFSAQFRQLMANAYPPLS
ncbi:glycoside hydrolase family 6 protein [Asanoa sp. NPDC050611]|uniref:glycoside hydrolase family 6 protein n=1 Tax=Asanoa sp. NPDC050611 TaxID=3157098 RepID=UPI0033F45CDD